MSLHDPNYVKQIVQYNEVGIPKLIFQIWISEDGREMPENWKNSPIEWVKYHPDYIYVLWDKDNALEFITKYYNEYLDTYINFKYVVSRCDMLRICILHKFGGIYSDLDNYPLKSIDEYIKDPTIDTYYPELKVADTVMINNNLIISKPDLPLFPELLEHIKNKTCKYHVNKYSEMREYSCVDKIYEFTQNGKHNIKLLPYRQFNPYPLGSNKTTVPKSEIVINQTEGGSWYDNETESATFIVSNWIFFTVLIILIVVFIVVICVIIFYPPITDESINEKTVSLNS